MWQINFPPRFSYKMKFSNNFTSWLIFSQNEQSFAATFVISFKFHYACKEAMKFSNSLFKLASENTKYSHNWWNFQKYWWVPWLFQAGFWYFRSTQGSPSPLSPYNSIILNFSNFLPKSLRTIRVIFKNIWKIEKFIWHYPPIK